MIVFSLQFVFIGGRATYGFEGCLGTLDSAWIPEEGSVIKRYERVSGL